MAALANGVMHVLETALLAASPSPPPPAAFLQTVAAAAAAFVGTEVPQRNERLKEAAVRALLALAAGGGGAEGEGEFTVITLSLSSSLMAVFRGLKEQWGGQEGGRRLRVVR